MKFSVGDTVFLKQLGICPTRYFVKCVSRDFFTLPALYFYSLRGVDFEQYVGIDLNLCKKVLTEKTLTW